MNEDLLFGEFGARPAVRVRIYAGERDHHGGQPLYTAIVQAARAAGLGGATVFKGIEGFGARSVVHAARVLDLSSDLPIVIELIDEPARMRPFIATLEQMLADGMMTIESIGIVYRDAGARRP